MPPPFCLDFHWRRSHVATAREGERGEVSCPCGCFCASPTPQLACILAGCLGGPVEWMYGVQSERENAKSWASCAACLLLPRPADSSRCPRFGAGTAHFFLFGGTRQAHNCRLVRALAGLWDLRGTAVGPRWIRAALSKIGGRANWGCRVNA